VLEHPKGQPILFLRSLSSRHTKYTDTHAEEEEKNHERI
jgi:hypothetical protein